MASDYSIGRKRSTTRQHSAEDQALNQIASEAESRLAARRAARAEARDIRTRELERQLREEEEEAQYKIREKKDLTPRRFAPTLRSSRRDSDDSSSEDGHRELKKEFYDLEEKYKKAMMNSAQLDNEKQLIKYQLDLVTDQLAEIGELSTEIQRELRDRTKELELKKRDYTELEARYETITEQLKQRDALIEEHGLVFISDEAGGGGDKSNSSAASNGAPTTALISKEAVKILDTFSGSLDERLKRFEDEKKAFEKQIKKLKADLAEEKEKQQRPSSHDRFTPSRASASRYLTNGTTSSEQQQETNDSHAETLKELSECRIKQKRAEQEVVTLEGTVSRLEAQVKRLKMATENGEKAEEEFKIEKRRWQKELRDMQLKKEELEMQNDSLQKRMDKMKKSTK